MSQEVEITNILKNHIGADNPITSREIAELLGLTGEDTFSRVRLLVKRAMIEFSLPVGSQTSGEFAGYFLIQDEEVLRNKYDSLRRRAQSILNRANAMVANYSKYWNKEVSFIENFYPSDGL